MWAAEIIRDTEVKKKAVTKFSNEKCYTQDNYFNICTDPAYMKSYVQKCHCS